jgi:hypothetical protein
VQFGEGAFLKFSQSLLLTTAFEDENDEDEYEYEMPNAKREAPGENARKRSSKRAVAGSAFIEPRRFSGNGVLTSPFPIWCAPSGVLSMKRRGWLAGPPLRAVQRVPWQRNAIRNRLPPKKRS